MYWKLNTVWLTHKITCILRVIKEKTVLHYGMGNRCNDGQYVLFLDYDQTPYEWVIEELLLVQNTFGLSTGFLFKTKNGYHVLFLDKMSLGRVAQIMDYTTCDKQYRAVPMYYARKIWVLRTSEKEREKIRYVGCCPNDTPTEKSQAHGRYLTQVLGVPPRDLPSAGGYDLSETLTLGYYYISKENN